MVLAASRIKAAWRSTRARPASSAVGMTLTTKPIWNWFSRVLRVASSAPPTKEMAMPFLPMRPVRPVRCM